MEFELENMTRKTDTIRAQDEDLDRLIEEVLEHDDFVLERQPGMSSVLDAAFNFTNSIVGAGIIGLPYAMKQAGVISGIILLVLLTYMVGMSLISIRSNSFIASSGWEIIWPHYVSRFDTVLFWA
jgi:hypothetical protein